MSGNNYGQDDPNQPVRPSRPPQGQPYNQPYNQPRNQQPEQQGKLVLGNFKDQNQQGHRPPHQQPNQPYQRPPSYTAQRNPQTPQGNASKQQAPQVDRYPYNQPGQFQKGNAGSPPIKKRNRGRIGCLTAVIVVVLLGIFAFTTTQQVLAFGSKISKKSPLSTETGYMGTSDRTNLLVLGYGGGSHDGAYLTDSLLTVSLLPQSHHTSLVSVPRDLFVQYPPNSGNYTKVNAIYEMASNNNKDPEAGGAAVTQKVSLVTGLDVKYWLTIDFNGFKKVIDSIGGINVYVPDSFNACYPKNDDAAVDASWIKVQFNKGMQHMNGATAIEYARAREPLEVCGKGKSENLAELTDFGRSARQQIIVKAVLSSVKQASTWPHLYSAMGALQQAIHTNMSLADLSEFALKMDLNDPKAAHIGLSNQNVLQDGQANDGGYILQPANGNWNAIPPYIRSKLYN